MKLNNSGKIRRESTPLIINILMYFRVCMTDENNIPGICASTHSDRKVVQQIAAICICVRLTDERVVLKGRLTICGSMTGN